MKRLGILTIGRDYFVPYIEWLASKDGIKFEISGYIDNEDPIYANNVDGYSDKRNNHTLEELAADSDMILSLGYWRIISGEIIRSVPMGILNLHHSYRLRYRGRHTATWAIMNEEIHHGTTLHYMSDKLDDGPILDSRMVMIEPDDTAGSLFERINRTGLEMLKDNLPIALSKDRLAKVEFIEPLPDYKMYKKKDLVHEIDHKLLASNPETFARNVRALTFPGMPKPYIVVDGTKIFMSAEHD